jgi:predicted dinucleotide-binding enzyme
MDIGIMGSGNVGRTLGEAWSRAGHSVRFGSREPSEEGTSGTHAEVAGWAGVVVFAVPGAATAELARALGPALEGKTVIDASNRVGSATLNSIAEILSVAPGARVYRAFSTVGWEVMADPRFGDERADLFYCGPDDDRDTVERLIEDVGFRPVWVGGAEEAETVDGLARAWFALALRRGMGRHLALRLLRD